MIYLYIRNQTSGAWLLLGVVTIMAGGQMEPTPVDVDKPRWDQSQFSGRLQHFARVTNPLLTFKSNKELDHASYLVSCARYALCSYGLFFVLFLFFLHKCKVRVDGVIFVVRGAD